MDQGEPVSVTVVERVAEHHGVDPTTLQPRLRTVVDPDALDALFRDGADASCTVEFTYKGCTVTVDATGEVEVRAAPTSTESDRTPAENSIGD